MTDLDKARSELLEIVSQVSQGSWTIVLLASMERVIETARREGAEEALRDVVQWHKAEAAKALSEADRLTDWGRWWRGDETWRDRAELHEHAAAHFGDETI